MPWETSYPVRTYVHYIIQWLRVTRTTPMDLSPPLFLLLSLFLRLWMTIMNTITFTSTYYRRTDWLKKSTKSACRFFSEVTDTRTDRPSYYKMVPLTTQCLDSTFSEPPASHRIRWRLLGSVIYTYCTRSSNRVQLVSWLSIFKKLFSSQKSILPARLRFLSFQNIGATISKKVCILNVTGHCGNNQR